MSPDRFNTIVKNRAAERVKQKIAKFEEAVGRAFSELHRDLKPNFYHRWSGSGAKRLVVPIFRHLVGNKATDTHTVGYPVQLWMEEEAAVEQELLATMDEMAKALASKAPTEPLPIAGADPSPTSEQSEMG
jgi:hypothetical protein